MEIVRDKIRQTIALLDELDLDMWLIFVRETPMQCDPAVPMVVGCDVVWQSFFVYTRRGDAIALVGDLDASEFEKRHCFSEILTYRKSVRDDIRELIKRLDPKTIALNYSTDNPAADGLTFGMHRLLSEYLSGTRYVERFESAYQLIAKLRARKLTAEVERISAAAFMTVDAWNKSVEQFRPGMTEKEIAAILDSNIAALGGTNSFATIVNAGDKSAAGHGLPGDAKLEPGDLLHVDFGARHQGFCADLQRLAYVPRRGEKEPPAELTEAFETVREAIDRVADACRPGVEGHEMDAIARSLLTDRGYPEYPHALGHQLGRAVHDGGAILGPKWDRYGILPTIPLELNNVFTIELEINLPGIGCVGLEEDTCVTESGARFLCPRQQELTIL
jgi:Xaa-Pro aminopeptidase